MVEIVICDGCDSCLDLPKYLHVEYNQINNFVILQVESLNECVGAML